MTMECTTARERLLEADPAELRGVGDGELAAHLAGCAGCRGRAAAILAGEAELDAALAGLAAEGAARLPAERPARVIPFRPRRWAPWALAPLAAAAAAALLWLRPQQALPPTSEAEARAVAQALFRPPPLVDPGAGRSAAVIQTRNPEITVVWLQ